MDNRKTSGRIPIVSSIILSSIIAFTAHAAVKDDLEQTQKELEESRITHAGLAERAQKLEEELASIQQKLVALAGHIQQAESDLSMAEDKLRILDEQMRAKEAELKTREKDLHGLVQAALRLSRTPPEAMVMMPGDITQTIRAGRALKMASDAIRRETEMIGLQMGELQELQGKVVRKREDIRRRQEKLAEERQAMTERLAERQALQEKLGRRQKEMEAKIAGLARKAEDLKGLLSSIEREEMEQREAAGLREEERSPTLARRSMRSFARAKGHVRTPVAGRLAGEFGEAGRGGIHSKGILIVARERAQVTAPYDGEVVFTGPFLNYGRLVILRHSDNFHTLLAGLHRIDAAVGQFLLEGEPIGAMGDGESGSRLYVELRKNNQPVDPTPWIRGLNEK